MPLGIPLELFGVFLGGVITLIGTAAFNWNKRRLNQQRLQRALANEVELMGSSLEKLAIGTHYKIFPETDFPDGDFEYVDDDYYQRLDHPDYHPLEVLAANRDAVFPTDVYESNANKIGMINSMSAESLIVFYSRIRQMKNTLAELEDALDSDELASGQLVAIRKLNSLSKNALQLRTTILSSLDVERSSLNDSELTWTDYERMYWRRGQRYARCERCGSEFDISDGYTTIEMGAFPASMDPGLSGTVYNLSLCGSCRGRFEEWLDRGAVERMT